MGEYLNLPIVSLSLSLSLSIYRSLSVWKIELASDLLDTAFRAVSWCSHENGLGVATTPQVNVIVGL
jgi:hypothetical protein